MSAERIEIFDEGSQIRILCNGSISTIISGPLGTHIEDAVIGAIRQQARDIKLLTQMLHDQRLVIDDLEHRRVKVCDENDKLRTDLAAAVARAEQAEARLAAIDGAPTVAYVNSLSQQSPNYLIAELLPPQDRPSIGTELIARPAKD